MTASVDFTQSIVLSHACAAVLIPQGTPITLEAGTSVFVTQALGGAVTVNVNGNLARVAASDIDALGMEPAGLPAQTAGSPSGEVDETLVWDQLRTCYDPEIPINIVELGLIYRCEIVRDEATGNRVEIDMTLTAPGCGMGPTLVDDVAAKVREVPHVNDVKVELTFDPPWNADLMSEAARLQTGMY
ncbi:MAG: putative Fe-S cluster assembly protein SufT [Gammaproteobacteria bacterium]|nr:putative Fe-S cluster assembly protein SufT [Gammaproteobacteria bacterium]